MRTDRQYPARPIVGVGAAIVISPEDARWPRSTPNAGPGIVLVKRAFEPLKGHWSLPGGAVEVGETLETAVAREIAEETGLAVEVGPIVDVFDRILHDESGRIQYHFVLIDYVCRARDGVLRAGSDVDEVVIADPARLDDYGMTAKAVEVIGKAMQHAVAK
jgi:8-oxo-dGTP diphosphatase